jgi:hypothetical protein
LAFSQALVQRGLSNGLGQMKNLPFSRQNLIQIRLDQSIGFASFVVAGVGSVLVIPLLTD